MSNNLERQLAALLRRGELEPCERTVVEHLANLPRTPFHVVLEIGITNSPAEVAAHCDGFFRHESSRFPLAAAYVEMNAFSISPGRWFFDLFAYRQYGGHGGYDWLADWDSEEYRDVTITGLERLQEVYASDALREPDFTHASELTDLLVVIKFQDLIRRAAPHMAELRFPLLATAHDFDVIYEVPLGS